METKTVYQYDKNGYYLQSLILDNTDKSPSGAWNIPANCTEMEPQLQEGYISKWNNTTWEQEKIPTEVLCYYDNGLSFRTVKSDYAVQDGEVLFDVVPTVEQLETVFSKYAEEVLAKAKADKLTELYNSFAAERDAITWVPQTDGTKFGYDRSPEDITNFIAARTRAELGNETYYKVYVNDTDTKQMIVHTVAMFNACLEQSAQEQIIAYTKFETVRRQLNACTTVAEINAITY